MRPRKSALAALLLVAAMALAIALTNVARQDRDQRETTARAAAIRGVVDTTGGGGWLLTFDGQRSRPLAELDPRWRPIFGRLLVDGSLGAVVGDPDGGWQRDGGDDYAFRPADSTMSDAHIVVDGWWDGRGSIGAQGAVQAAPPHRLYEATLWRGKLAIIYFSGPRPDQYEVLAESSQGAPGPGWFRIFFCMARRQQAWLLHAVLQDANGGRRIAEVSARDSRLPPGGQGIGILGPGGRQGSRITGIAVSHGLAGRRSLEGLAGCQGPSTAL